MTEPTDEAPAAAAPAPATSSTAVDEKEDESANIFTLMQQVGEYLDNHSDGTAATAAVMAANSSSSNSGSSSAAPRTSGAGPTPESSLTTAASVPESDPKE